jgi:hypothetical protein
MKFRDVILLLLVAFFAFGGTFTCTTNDGDNTIHTKPPNNTNPDKSR